MAARSRFSMCARRGSTAPAIRCSRSTCRTAGSKSRSRGWCRGGRAGSYWSTTAMASPRRAARRLAGLGYSDAACAAGGVAAWEAAGHPLFPSTNVPSKAFAEIVEIERHTPHVTPPRAGPAAAGGPKLTVLDSRTVEEFNRFHVPGAVSCPGAELVHRFDDLVPDPRYAGRRLLRRPHPQHHRRAVADQRRRAEPGGLARRRHSGLAPRRAGAGSATRRRGSAGQRDAAAAAARQRAEAVAARFGVRRIDARRSTPGAPSRTRTTYLLDVRTPEEFAAGHLPGSVSAEGGQLVQAIDRWVGIRGARLVLLDDIGARAVMTAQWLQQMGWDGSRARPTRSRAGAGSRRGRTAGRLRRRAGDRRRRSGALAR